MDESQGPAGPQATSGVPPCAAESAGGSASPPAPSALLAPLPEGRRNKSVVAAYSHSALIDLMIAHPEWHAYEWAQHFGYSQSWISQLICSDAFREQLAARQQEIVDPRLRATVEERFKANLQTALDLISDRLASGAVGDSFLLRTAEMSARALGYGAKAPVSQAPVELNLHLHQMSDALTRLLHEKRGAVVDVTPTPVSEGASS